MKQHYNTNWLSSLSKGLLLSFSLLLVSGMAMAQLSGNYTINSDSATSGINFKSFADLNAALKSAGVQGPVVVDVVPGSGPYSESVTFDAISGASATNTITINGHGEKIVNTSSSAVIEFNGADYFTLDSLIIDAQGTGNGTQCIHFWKGADYNTVKNSQLIISKYTGTSNSTGYVVFSNSLTGNSAGDHGSHNVIDNNKMWNGGAGTSVGPYYGCNDYRSSTYANTTGNNQFTNNDIENVYYYWFYMYYANGFTIDNNKLHNDRSNSSYAYTLYAYYCRTTTHAISFSGNEIYNMSPSNYLYNYTYQTQGTSSLTLKFNNNSIHNNSALYFYNYLGYYGSNMEINNNAVHSNDIDYYLYNMMGYYAQGNTTIADNRVSNNKAGYYVYAFYTYNAQGVTMERNAVFSNSAQYGVYGYYIYYMNGTFRNNTYYNNSGDYYNYGMLGGYSNSLDIVHNTFVLNDDVQYENIGLYMYMSNTISSMNVKNNSIVITGDVGSGYNNYLLYTYVPNQADMNIENNNLFANNSSNNMYSSSSSLAAFNSDLGTTTNIEVDPKFVDLNNGNLTPTNPAMANYGQPGYATVDFNLKTRTACGPDLGAFEYFVDHNASNLVFTGTNECGGYSEEIGFTFNNGTNIDLIGARAYYTINVGSPGEKTVVETIDTIYGNGSKAYTFMSKPVFNEPGTQTIEVGLLCDDSAANNTLTTTITITPAPHSFELAQGTTFGGYYNGGTKNNPDVTAPSVQVDYEIMNPARYANSAYGSDWTATVSAMTENGTDVSSNASLTAPGSAAGIVSVSPASSLQDSLIYISVTVTDVNTGCDSTFGRWLYVPHVPMVDFSAPDGCDGEVVAFVNETTQPTGATEYMWDFDDPMSGTENNMSTISDPVHAFSTYGSYDVKLTAWNFDYPKFVYEIVKRVEISPVPSVDFKVINACEGSDISFTNNTSLPAGITGTIDYKWSFGDGKTSILKNPKHQYTAAGGYPVTLTASLRGCATSLTKNANQFATPNADFSVAGTCNLEDIQFTNASTIAIGKTGFKWDFNDGNISNLRSPSHAFAMPGAHTVKLKAISEFGCEDEIQKTFTLEESPKADFVFTDACSETDVQFTRTGSLPSGASSIFEWDFDGERISTRENDKHRFSKVGVKTVTLTVSSDNGCSDMISKEFVVKLQAKADFIADDVCEGEDVVFTNSSEVARGTLQYEWRFGGADANGNTTSSLTSPRHNYQLLESGVTESFRVTLLAIVPDGCSDSIAKTVTVNAKSDASFDAEVNWRNLVISNQATTDPTNTYNWRFGDGGRSSDVTPSYKYSDDKATYEVCLAIINNAGCISESCEEVELDLATSGINDIAANDVFSVYPNPNTGKFNVKVNDPQSNLSIVILDATGKTIKTVETTAHEVYNVDISDVAAGVYMVQVVNGNYSAMQRVTVAK